MADTSFICDYCGKHFAREKTLFEHMCLVRDRMQRRDDRHAKLGFRVYQQFYEMSYGRQKASRLDFLSFAKSQFYTSFVKFARYVLDINAIRPEDFVAFLVKAAIPLHRWENAAVYETFIRELSKKESAEAAVERNILLMQQWERETGEPWYDFFRKISPVLATTYIRAGRISPWVLYTAQSSGDLLARMSPEQHALIRDYIDPDFWSIKLRRHKEDVRFIETVLTEAGI